MKVFLSALFFCATLLDSTHGQGIEYYSGRYDNIDINNIFKSRLLNHYVDCLLDKKPCPPEGKDLKSEFLHLSLTLMPIQVKYASVING